MRWTYVQGAVVVLDDCEKDGGLLGADVGGGHVGVKCCRFVLERCCWFIFDETWIRIATALPLRTLDERTSEEIIRKSLNVSVERVVSAVAVVFVRDASACGVEVLRFERKKVGEGTRSGVVLAKVRADFCLFS